MENKCASCIHQCMVYDEVALGNLRYCKIFHDEDVFRTNCVFYIQIDKNNDNGTTENT